MNVNKKIDVNENVEEITQLKKLFIQKNPTIRSTYA
jgi:hypothetical protein